MGAWIETIYGTGVQRLELRLFPLWEHGLKLAVLRSDKRHTQVVPFMGAWIETDDTQVSQGNDKRLFPLWEHGLKLSLTGWLPLTLSGCSLYGSMD